MDQKPHPSSLMEISFDNFDNLAYNIFLKLTDGQFVLGTPDGENAKIKNKNAKLWNPHLRHLRPATDVAISNIALCRNRFQVIDARIDTDKRTFESRA